MSRRAWLGHLSAFPARHPDFTFWLGLLALNGLLFLPIVLINRESGTFLPQIVLNDRSPEQIFRQALVWRRSADLLRFNSELLLLAGLWVALPPLRRPGVRRGIFGFYLLAFAYYLYEGVSLTFFSVEPVFYSQFRMSTVGFSFFLQNARVSIGLGLGIVLLLAGGIAIFWGLLRLVLRPGPAAGLRVASRWALALLLGFAAVQTFSQRERLSRPELVFSSLTAKLQQNLRASAAVYRNVQRFDDRRVRAAYDYADLQLRQQPNIYVIFVESYGTVLYKRPDWRAQYRALTDRLEETLAGQGWHVATARSLAPTWGGGSWMSYTSALFGLRVDSDPQYYALLDKYQLEEYPDLGRFLRTQGYRYYRLTALSMGLPETEWKKYINFFGVDRWLKYEDLAFVGPEYGWGPAPPDQYSLHFVRQAIRQETERPFLFFTITQNSHYPWTPLPPLADSWQALNRPGPAPPASSELIEHSQRRQNYWNAIEYQLAMLTDFILTEPEEDAIFVLVGDHQPPRVSRRDDGWDTPIHIISRNRDFVESFQSFGFTPGLAVWTPEPTFRHEGFYSLFVRQLLSAYGDPPELPGYYPEGVGFQTE